MDNLPSESTSPSVTIVVVTWNSAPDIEECLSSIMAQTYSNFDVIVVDSASNDNTVDIVCKKFPLVRVIVAEENLGYLRGNRLGMQHAEGDYVVVCNDDIRVEHDWLAEMVSEMLEEPEIGMVTPCIVMYDNPEVINAAGNTLHYSGLYGPRGKNAPKHLFSKSEDVPAVSGCCFMVSRDLMMRVDGFSKDFDLVPRYWHSTYEDADLSWRVQSMGYRIRYVATSILYHKYEQPSQDNWRRFSQRCYTYPLFVLRNFDTSALAMIAPIIVIVELAWLALAVSKGRKWVKTKVQAWIWFTVHWKDWSQMRERMRSLRKKSYWDLLIKLDPKIDLAFTAGGLMGKLGDFVLNRVFILYYWVLCFCADLIFCL